MLPTSHPAKGTGLGTLTSPAHSGRRTWTILALSGLMLIALGLRLHAAWQRNHERPHNLGLHFVGDEPGYEALAYALLQGSFFQEPVRVPVYPMFIAATYYVLGERSPANLLYVQAFVGVLAVPLTYLLARRFTGMIPALVAAGIVAFDAPLIYHARQIYSEVLYTPLLLATLLALLWALQVPRIGRFAWAGASMGVATLCRPSTALIPVILPLLLPRVWHLQQKVGAFLVSALALAAVIAPWTYHNWRAFRHFLPLNVSPVLWQGSPEFYHLIEQNRHHMDIWAEELNPQRNGGHDPSTIDGHLYFTRRALQSIRAEPVVYVTYSLKKAAYLWLGNPMAEGTYVGIYDWQTLRQWHPYSSLTLLHMLISWQLPILALVGLVFFAGRGQLRPLLPLVIVCAYFTLVHMITWPEVRYSQPLHPLLAIIVGAAGGESFNLFKQRLRHPFGQSQA